MASSDRGRVGFGRIFSPRRRSASAVASQESQQKRRERRANRWRERFRRFALTSWQSSRIVQDVCDFFRTGGAETARAIREATGSQVIGIGYGRMLRLEPLEPRQLLTVNLGLGDLAVSGYAADDPDTISMVLLEDVDSGTQFTVTDEGWLGAQTGFRGTGEGETTFQFNSTITAGTQISLDFTNQVYSHGLTAVAGAGDRPSLATAGDSILIYNGGFANRPTSGTSADWITGFQMNGSGAWDANATDANTSAKPTVFVDGDSSFAGFTPEVDNAVLNNFGNIVGSPGAIRSVVYNSANWTVNDTTPPTIPGTTSFFTSIQAGINAVSSGSTIDVLAGTYAENVSVNKTVTLRGAQAGTDGRDLGRTGLPATESVMEGAGLGGLFNISVDDVTIDGFTIQGQTGGFPGAAIWMQPGTEGTDIRNNIIQNNVIGVMVSNNSASNQTVIEKNLFQNNTNPGAASGHGIYADQFTAGVGMQNVRIDNNKFTNSSLVVATWTLGISNTDATPFADITFSNNEVTNHGRGMYFFNTDGVTVSDSTISGTSNYAIGIFGGYGADNANVSISGNTLTGNNRGVYVDGYSGELTIAGNQITGGNIGLDINDSDITRVNLSDLTLSGNTTGGTISNVGVVSLTMGAADDAFTVTPTSLEATGTTTVQPITLSGVANIEVHGAGDAGGGDSLTISGTFGTVVYDYTNANDGSVDLGSVSVAYTGLEPITNTGTATDVVFNLTAMADNATLEDIGGGMLRLSGATFETTDFLIPTSSLTINGGGDDDEFTVDDAISIPSVTLDVETVNLGDDLVATTIAGGANTLEVNVLDDDAQIQDAIALIAATGIVHVAAGTYTGDVNINKSLTLRGNQFGVNPNDGSWNDTRTVAANESIIHGAMNLSLQNDIVVDGFTFERTATNEGHILIGSGNPTGVGATSSFDIKNNRFIGTRNGGTIWAGIHTNFLNDTGALSPGNQFTADQNRFEIAGTGSGAGILVNANRPGSDGLGSTTITDNYVANSPSNGLNVNRPGSFLTLTGNHLVNDDIFTFQVHNGLIDGNTVINSPQGSIQVVASSFEDFSDVTVSNNTIINDVSLLTNNFSQIDIRGPNSGTNVVTGNTVTLSGTLPGSVAGIYGVRVRGTSATGVSNLTVSNNTLTGGGIGGAGNATFPATSGVFVDTDLLTSGLDLHVEGNFISGWVNAVSVFDTVPGSYGGLPIGATFELLNNDLSGNSGLGVASGAGELVNASGNWWGTNTAAGVAAEVTAAVDYTGWLEVGTDVGGDPLDGFQGDFSVVIVDDDSPQSGAIGRINEGIAVVDAGGTVRILGGTYMENVDATSKSVVLSPGASPAQVTVDGNMTLDSDDTLAIEINGLSAATQYDNFIVNGVVTLDDATLALSGSLVPSIGNSFTIIDNDDFSDPVIGTFNGLDEGDTITLNGMPLTVSYVGGAGTNNVTLTVTPPDEVWVDNDWVITTDIGPAGLSTGDTVESDADDGDDLVSGLIFGYDAYATIGDGIMAVEVGGTVHVLAGTFVESLTIAKDVTIDGQSDTLTHLDAGGDFTAIAVSSGFTVDISGIEVSNFGSTGIQVQGDLTLSDSTVTDGLVVIWVDGGTLDMSSTVVSGAMIFGVQVSDSGDANISSSEISGTGSTAAGVIISSGHADIEGSKLGGNNRGLLVNASGTASITDSDLSGNSIGGVVNATATAVDASGNWWGSNLETAVDTAAVGLVDFTPYLHSGTDTDGGARGFAGDFSHLHVTALGAQTGGVGRIQEGVNDVDVNGTVDVHAGTYTELVTVNKTVNLHGAQFGIDARTRSGAESIVNGPGGSFSLQANNIVLDGFTVEGTTGLPLGTGIHATSLFSGYQIANNIIQDNTIGIYLGSSGVIETVVEQNLIRDNNNPGAAGGTGIYSDQGLSNVVIQDNKFAGDNFTAGMNLIGLASAVSDAQIVDNEFTDGNQLVLFNVDGSLVDGNTFTGTTLAGTAIFVGGGSDGLTISGNMITNRAGSGISLSDAGFGSNSNATITGNIITQDVSLLSSGTPTTRTMISVSQTTGTSSIDNNQITLSGGAFGPNITAVRGIVVAGAATENVDVTDNMLDGGGVGTVGVLMLSSLTSSGVVSIAGNTIDDFVTGVSASGGTLDVGTNNIITGGTTGLLLSGSSVGLTGLDLGDLEINGVSGDYITLANSAFDNQDLDGTGLTLDGTAVSSMTPAQLFAVENKITHEIDNNTLGLVVLVANTIFVTPATTPTATDNDYTRIKNAIEAAGDGWTINLQGTFDWTETNAAASWALGNDGVVSPADDYAIVVPVGLENVTFTASGGLGTAIIDGPGDLAGVNLEGVLIFDGGDNQGWTISNMRFLDFDLSLGFFNGAGGSDAFNNTTITNNYIRVPADLNVTDAPADVNQNIGIHYSFGTNQTISNNTIELVGDGASDGSNFSSSVGMQSNTSGGNVYDGLLIDNNTINVTGTLAAQQATFLGIWENAHAHSSNITVQNNDFFNLTGDNAAANLMRAFRVTSHSSGSTTVIYFGNTVDGANIGFQWLAGSNFAGNEAVEVIGNTLTNVNTGLLIQSNGVALLSDNSLTNSGAMLGVGTGVDVAAGSIVTIDDSSGDNEISGFATGIQSAGIVNVLDNSASIHGNAIGIDVIGGTATISGNHIYDNTTGISFSGGGGGSVTGNIFNDDTLGDADDDNDTDLLLTSTAGLLTSLTGNTFAGDTFFIDNQGTQDLDVTAGTLNTFDESDNFRIEDKMHHRVDTDVPLGLSTGLITWVAGNLYVTTPGSASVGSTDTDSSIQRGVDAANVGNTVNVEAGTFDEQVVINKSITVDGAGNGTNPLVDTIIKPSSAAVLTTVYNTGVQAGAFFNGINLGSIVLVTGVGTAGVTLSDFTIDGDLVTSLPAGTTQAAGLIFGETGGTIERVSVENMNSIPLNTRSHGMWINAVGGSAVTVEVDDAFVHLFNRTGILSRGNELTVNIHDSEVVGPGAIGPDNVPNAITMIDTAHGNVTNNTISAGHFTGSDFRAAGVLLFKAATGVLIDENEIFDYDDGIILAGTDMATVQNNDLHDNVKGIRIEGVGGDGADSNTITGNTITNNSLFGIELGDSAGTGNTLISNTISSTSGVGINLLGGSVSFGAGNTVTGGAVGLAVDGTASPAIVGNTLNDLTFTGQSAYYVLLTSGALDNVEIDGTSASFDGIVGGGTLIQNFAIEDKLRHAPDDAAVGHVRFRTGEVFVTTPGTGLSDETIQNAVDAAIAGDTVHVATGTFQEQVDIGKNLTLIGAGDSTVILSPPVLATKFLRFGNPYKPVVTAHDADVSIQDVKIDGDGQGNANNRIAGLAYYNASGLIDDVTTVGTRNTPADGVQAGYGIFVFNDDAVARTVTIQDSDVSDYQKGGIIADGVGLTANITTNTVTGYGPVAFIAQNGIQVSNGATGTVSGNTVSGHEYTGPDESAGIIIFAAASGVVASGNMLSDNELGVYTNSSATISGNIITGSNAAGIAVAGGSVSALGNSATGGSIGLYAGGGNVKVQGNTLTDNDVGIQVEGGAIVDAGSTSFDDGDPTGLGNSTGGNILTGYTGTGGNYAIEDLNLAAESDVYARFNDFGPYVDISIIEDYVFDDTDDPTRSMVIFAGALNQQAAPAIVYVDDTWTGTALGVDADGPGNTVANWTGIGGNANGTQFGVDQFATIQDALIAVALGGSIYVYDGTYAEILVIDQTVSLFGFQAGLDARGRVDDESTITSPVADETFALVHVTAAGVTIDGFTIDGDAGILGGVTLLDGSTTSNAARSIVVDGDNGQVLNNRIMNIYRRGVQYGFNVSPIGGLVSQNDFDLIGADDTLGGTNEGFALLSFSDASFMDNDVDDTHNGAYYIQVYAPNVTPIEISGNDINALNTGIALNETSSSLPDITITGNDVSTGDNGVGLLLWSVGGALDFNNNTFTGTGVGDVGVYGWVGTAGVPMNVTLTGGSITGYETGVYLTNQETTFGPALAGGTISLGGVTIATAAGGTGVFVEDGGVSTFAVHANITDDSDISTGGGTGILVTGANASADITDNDSSIHGNAVGIDVVDGSVTVTNNDIYDNGIGVRFTNSGSGSLSGNEFNGATDNDTDLRLDSDAGSVTIGAGNLFGGEDYFIDNRSSQDFDLTSYTSANFEGFDPGVLADDFHIEDHMFHGPDNGTSGVISWVANTLYVSTPGSGVNDEKIQYAIDTADPGNTIHVEAGTYHEAQISIYKALTILGAGSATTFVDGDSTPIGTVGLVRITAPGDVTFDGFTVREAGQAGGVRVGIYTESGVGGVTYTVTHNAILGTNNPLDDQDYGFYSNGGLESLVFQNNMLSQTGSNPILLERHYGATDVSFNTFDRGVADGSVDAYFNMNYGGTTITSLQKVHDNTIDMGNDVGPFDNDHRGFAITFAGDFTNSGADGRFTNVEITDNQITNLKAFRRGIGLWNNGPGSGVSGDIVGADISGNEITGDGGSPPTGSQGIRILGRHTGTEIVGNTITNVDLGIRQQVWNGHAGIGSHIHGDNELTDNNTGILIGAGSAIIEDNDATITGNGIGIDVDGGTVLAQNNDLTDNTIAVRIQNGGIADLGQNGVPSPTNYTGLGISTGGNDFSSYTVAATAASGAIVNLNTGGAYSNVGPQGYTGPEYDVAAFGNSWNINTPAGIENVVWHDADNSALGFVDYLVLSNLVVSLDPLPTVTTNEDVNEGSTATVYGEFTNDAQAHQVTVTWGDGSPDTVQILGAGVFTFTITSNAATTYTDDPNGPTQTINRPISVKVEEVATPTNFVTDASLSVDVNNVVPVVPLVDQDGDNEINEGQTFNLVVGPRVDPGQDTITAYTIFWGDGDSTFVSGDPLTSAAVHSHLYADGVNPPTRTITIDVLDDDGTWMNVGSLMIDVNNVNPTAGNFMAFNSTVNEGGTTTVFFTGPFTDPGNPDTPFHFAFDFNGNGIYGEAGEVGDGTYAGSGTSTSATVPAQFLADDDDSPRTVRGRIIDNDGGFTEYSVTIAIDNVAPVVDAGADTTVFPNTVLNHVVSFTDPGADSPWTVRIDWDGIPGFDETFSVPGHSFNIADHSSWTYDTSDIGTTFTVTVEVDDNDGGVDSDMFDVTVVEDTLRVVDFQMNVSGFDVTFNRALNLSDLNLYDSLLDGSPSVLEAPDVTLVRNGSEQILGSIIWAADTNTLTFVKTGGVLAAGSYDVTLISSAMGFHDGGNLLDGDGDFDDNEVGDDFITSFVVDPAPVDNRIVSIGDFSRGAGQDVHVPTVEMGGLHLPVFIDNANGVQAVDVDVLYNPTLLNITAALLGAGPTAAGGWSITTNSISIDATHTLLKITISGINALSGSNVEIIKLNSEVPSTATYGDSQVIRLLGLRVNEDLMPSQGDFAVHKAVYVGDADGDGAYGGTDAGLISRVVVALDSGFDAHDWTNPRIVGDASGDGTLSGLDASYVAQEAVFIDRPEVPPIPGVPLMFSIAGVDPEYSIDENIPATPGGTVTIPIELNVLPSETVVGSTFHVHYDEDALTFDSAAPGDFWSTGDGWNLFANMSGSGRVTVAMFNTMGETSNVGQGVIAELDFSVSNTFLAGYTTTLDVEAANPNEGGLNWTDDADGSAVFAGLPGDYNRNGVGDVADYIIWRKYANTSVPNYTLADGTGDGQVDQDDYDLWTGNFGETSPGSGSSAPPVASEVPTAASAVHSIPVELAASVMASGEPTPTSGTDYRAAASVAYVTAALTGAVGVSNDTAAGAYEVAAQVAWDEALAGLAASSSLPTGRVHQLSSEPFSSPTVKFDSARSQALLTELALASKHEHHLYREASICYDRNEDDVEAIDELFADLDSDKVASLLR